jgi:hypothetical protein
MMRFLTLYFGKYKTFNSDITKFLQYLCRGPIVEVLQIAFELCCRVSENLFQVCTQLIVLLTFNSRIFALKNLVYLPPPVHITDVLYSETRQNINCFNEPAITFDF